MAGRRRSSRSSSRLLAGASATENTVMRPILAMIRKDLLLFFGDTRSVIVSFVVPIAIASFFGSLFRGGVGGGPARTPIAVIDHDSSIISRAIVKSASEDSSLVLLPLSEDSARAAVKRSEL